MLNTFSVADLSNIARAGGSLIVDGSRFSSADLSNIARAGGGTGATLTVHNAQLFSTNDLANIARAGAGRVTFSGPP